MSTKDLTKKIMASAFAVAGIAMLGNNAQAQEVELPELDNDSNNSVLNEGNKKRNVLLPNVKFMTKGKATGAAAPTTTLDYLQSKASTVMPTLMNKYTLTELTGTAKAPAGTQEIGFNGKRYYFTPAETTAEKANMLSYLAGSMAIAYTTTGASSENYLFTDGTNYWTIDTTKLPASAYTLTEASSGNFLVNIDGTTYNVGVKDQGTGDQSLYFKWDNSGTTRKMTNGTSGDKDFTTKVSAGTGDTNAYYKWTKDSSDNLQLTAGDSENYNLIAKYSTAGTTVTQTGTTASVTATGTSSSPTLGYAGIIQNPATSISNTLYLNNKSSANITQDTTGNKYARVYGGVISNGSNSGINITADFKGNHFDTTSTRTSSKGTLYSYSAGGAISNYGTSSTSAAINEITGDFVGNYVNATGGTGAYAYAYGGAIANYGYNSTYKAQINKIVGDFVGNYASDTYAYGGAIYNNASSTISSIVGDFVGNYASAYGAYGGAIKNNGTIGSIEGDFVGNYASASSFNSSFGGAINNGNTISSIVGDFVGNYAYSSSSSASGGAIYNDDSSISSIVGDFVGNYAYSSSSSASGGAIYNSTSSSISSITGDFVGNYATTTTTSSSSVTARGGAIYNDSSTISSIVGDFVGNYSKTASSAAIAYGGAIYNGDYYPTSYSSSSKITLGGNTFTGNYTQKGTNDPVPNSIYNAGVINIADGATVTVNDGYNGLDAGQLNIGTGSTFNLTINNGEIQTADTLNLGTVTNNGTINYGLDVDFTAGTTDKIKANSLSGTSKIIISAIKLLTDPTSDGATIVITNSTSDILKTAYTISGGTLSVHGATNWYDVTYSYDDVVGGYLTFNIGEAPFIPGGGTIDDVRVASTAYLALDKGSHGTYTDQGENPTLSTTKDANHPDVVVIDGTVYYFNAALEATTEEAKKVRNLAATGAAAIKEVESGDNWIFNVGTKFYTYTAKSLPISAYTLTETTTPAHWGITIPTYNETTHQYENKTYDLVMRDQGSGDQSLYFLWDTTGGRKLTPSGATSSINDLVVKASGGTGTSSTYYKWTQDDNNNWQLTQTDGSTGYNFIAKYSTAGTTVTQTGDTVPVTATASSSSNPTLGYAGIIQDPTDPISDTLYLNNATSATITKSTTANKYARVYGGVISNSANSGINITANFKGNHFDTTSTRTSSSGYLYSYSVGGAISNYGTSSTSALINEITGDFVGNYVNATGGTGVYVYAYGGAIANYGYNSTYKAQINKIVGDFVGNYASGGSGGAIYNYNGTISSIVGDFVGNYASGGYGGAINNESSTISSIVGDFVGNYASGSYGGAIRNYSSSTISSIVGDFVGNYVSSSGAYGGAISNSSSSTISSIVGDFVGNYVSSSGSSSYAYGGAISNSSATISSIVGDFVGNYASASPSSNYAQGGAIYNYNRTISSIVGDFVGNYVYSSTYAYGGAINNESATISSITGDFVGNYAYSSSFYAYGGAICNYNSTISSITGDFVGNYAKTTSTTKKAYGGAIYNGIVSSFVPAYNANSKITLSGNTFTGNYVDKNGTITPNGIYNAGIINIADGATVTINDGYNGLAQAQLNIGTGSTFNLTINNGKIQTADTLNLGTVTNNGTINYGLDVSLTAGTSDQITLTSLSSGAESIIIKAINLITGTGSDKIEITLTDNDTLKTAYTLSDDIMSHISKATGVTYDVTSVKYDSSTGKLIFNAPLDSLALKVHTGDPLVRVYGDPAMTANETVGENLGTLAGGTGAKLTINGGGFAINGGTYTGITVGSGQTLIFNNVSDVTGFADSTAVTNGGTLEITGSKFTSKIANNASMTLKGTNTLNGVVSGDNGETVVSTGTTTVGASFTQKDLTVESGAGLSIAADNLNITNAVQNDGTITLGAGTLGSSITDKTSAATGKTVIDGDVRIAHGKTVSQAMEVTSGTGHKLTANVASIGGTVTNNANLAIFSQDDITSESTHFAQDVDGSGTTTIQRNVNVDSTIANNVVIDKYIDTSSNTHYANVVVGEAGTLGAAGKTIEIKAGSGTDYNTLTMSTGSIGADSITNNSKLVINNSTDGTLSKAISGSGILNIATTGENAASTVVTTGNTITNQNINVQSGILKIANASHLAGTTNVNVANGAVLDTIDNVINNYSSIVKLANGAVVNADINATSKTAITIDTYGIADGTTSITLGAINSLTTSDFQSGSVSITADGVKVDGESIEIFSGTNKTVTVKGSGLYDGKVLVSESTSQDKLNGAVYTSETKSSITYTMGANEEVNNDKVALGYIQDQFKIKSDSSAVVDKRTVMAKNGTYGLIVGNYTTGEGDGKSLTIDNVTLQNFATGTVSGVDDYNGKYEGIVTVKNGASLNVKDTYFKVISTDGNTNKIAIANYGTLNSDPSVYEGSVMNYKGATATIAGDTFQNINRTGENGGAIFNEAGDPSALPDPIPAGTLTLNNVTATNNRAATGGVLYNAGTATINGGTYTDNIATGLGGAIYTTTNLTINSDSTNGAVSFSGNKQAYVSDTEYTANDIYMAGTDPSNPMALNLNAADTTTNTITLGSGVTGTNYMVNVNNGTTGKVTIASLTGANSIALKGGELYLSSNTNTDTLTASDATTLNAANGLTVKTLTVEDGKTFTNSGSLTVTSTLTNGHEGTSTAGTITNDGTLNLKGDTPPHNFENEGTINGNGLLVIGDGSANKTLLSSVGSISNKITIAANSELDADPDNLTVTDGTLKNDGTFRLTAGTIKFNVANNAGTSGHTDITADNVDFDSTAHAINQQINIIMDDSSTTGNSVLVANGLNIGGDVAIDEGNDTRDSILRLTGGTMNHNITGYTKAGNTTYGNVEIAGDTIFAGSKTAQVSNLSVALGKALTNNGTFTVFDGLTNNGTIDGTGNLHLLGGTDATDTMANAGTIGTTTSNGKVYIGSATEDAYVENTATGSIIGDITIAQDSTLRTASDNVTDSDGLTNDGNLIFNNTANGSINQNISGSSGSSNGVVEIAAAADATIDMNGKTIANNTIKLTSGTLKAGSSSGAVDLSSADKIVAGDGILSVQDGKTGTIQLGTVDTETNNKNLNVAIDADFMHGATANDRGILGNADVINATSVTGDNKIHVSDIKLILNGTEENAHPIGTEFTAKIANGAAASVMDVSNTTTTITSFRDGVGNILLSYIVDSAGDGYLTGKHTTLNDAITSSVDNKMYFMDSVSYTTIIDGPKTLNGNSLAITTNGNNISLDTTSVTTLRDGIVFNPTTGSDQVLSIIGTNSDVTQPNTTISGFDTAIDNTAGGRVNLTDVTMTNNTKDVVNDGDAAGKGVYLAGTNNINSIVNSAGDASKGQTTITGGTATITVLKQKGVTVNADATANLTDIAQVSTGTSGITNDGDLIISGGTSTTAATNNNTITKSASTTGNATTTIAAGSNINNNSTITQKVAVISGVDSATSTPAATLTNTATGAIKANTVNVNEGATLTNNGSIVAADGASASTVNVKANADLNLNSGSSTKADAVLESATSDLTITDTAVLTGDVKTDNGASINLVADQSDIALSTAVAGSITDTTGTGDGNYVITATTADLLTDKTVTIDKAIAGALEVDVNDSTNAVITDAAYTTTAANINVGNGSDLVLENTTAGTKAVESAISSNDPVEIYTLTVSNSNAAGGTTDINNTITGAGLIIGDGGVTNLNSIITDAGTILAKAGTTNLNAGSATSTSAQIGTAAIQIYDGATAGVVTTSDNFALTNNVDASSENAILSLNGKAGTAGTASDPGTQFNILSTINRGTVQLGSGQLNLPNESILANADAVMIGSGATLNAINGATDIYNTAIGFEDASQIKVDVNAVSALSDKFANPQQAAGNGVVLTDLVIQDLDKVVSAGTNIDLKNTTNLANITIGSELLNKKFTAMAPIKMMEATLDPSGMLNIHPAGGRNDYNSFNPAIVAAPIAAQMGGYLTQLNSYDEAFRNLDMKMLMTREERQAYKMANRYASEVQPQVFSQTYLPEKDSAGWFRPYASFERVGLKNGPGVDNTMYGSYFGGDSVMKELRNGWDYQWSVYVGYNGSHQAYAGNSIYQNGGTLGATGIWYKNDFFTALTANVGASVANASTMFGSDDFPMLMSGVASKTGYNWELAKGKFIIQPNYLMSYTFVNTFDYTNAAGVRIKSDPLHAINITPGLKFIGNLKNGWQPYASVQMVWSIMDQTDFRANNIPLPQMSVKPYFQYGVGVQKRWGERFTGFGQAMLRNGGRNGIALSAGFRWALGKNPEDSVKNSKAEIKTKDLNKSTKTKVIKSIQDLNKSNVETSKAIKGTETKVNNNKATINATKSVIKSTTSSKKSQIAGFFAKMDGDPTYVVTVRK